MSGSEALFQAPVLSTMLFDSLDMEGYKRALTASMEYGGLRVSRRSRCDWASYPICTHGKSSSPRWARYGCIGRFFGKLGTCRRSTFRSALRSVSRCQGNSSRSSASRDVGGEQTSAASEKRVVMVCPKRFGR